jgi:uncharacterized protein (TIGR02145 family)/prepilin-type N-terminal cleavage/methylation domain-containing protein
MKRQGFTLIELLAVIVILAIVAIIAVPSVINVIEDARKGSFKNSVYGIIKAAEYNHALKTIKDSNPGEIKYTYANGVESSTLDDYKLEYKGDKPENGTIIINEEGQVSLALHDGTYCAEKGYEDSEVTLSDKTKEECTISSEITFACGQDLVDVRDGQEYKTVQIGNQCWMAENLKYIANTEGYNNIGTGTSWSGTNNCGNQGSGYNGLLYQWPVAMKGSTVEGSQGLCPEGWHIPTDDEWKTLEMYLGMTQVEVDKIDVDRGTNQGDKLKGLTHSWCAGTSGCGESGFNASPAGDRYPDGSLNDVGSSGFWWTSTSSGSGAGAWFRLLWSGNALVFRTTGGEAYGWSVRCLWGQ